MLKSIRKSYLLKMLLLRELVQKEGTVRKLDLVSCYDETDYIILQHVNSVVAESAVMV